MLRNLFIFTYLWLVLLFSLLLFLIFRILSLFSKSFSDRYLQAVTTLWARNLLWAMGVKIECKGCENIPKHHKILLLSNHQSNIDIPVLIAVIPKLFGFLAKQELMKVYILRIWIKALGSVYIKRQSRRSTWEAFEKTIEKASDGHPMLIFPEGTRSKKRAPNAFHLGFLRYLSREISIVPVSISGSYLCYEADKRFKPGTVQVHIHPPMHLEGEDKEEIKAFAEKVEHQVKSALY